LRLAANVGELLRLRIDINHFDLVNDPGAAGKKAATGRGRSAFHFVVSKN